MHISVSEIGLQQAAKRYRLGTFERLVLTNAPDERNETMLRALVQDLVAALNEVCSNGAFLNEQAADELRERATNLGCLDDLA